MKLMSAKDAAKYFNVHPNTIRLWHSNGTISAVTLGTGNRKRYDIDSLKPAPADYEVAV